MTMPDELLVDCAHLLQGWSGISHLGAKEVLAWWRAGEPAFALRGDALRMERICFREEGIANREHSFDLSLQRAFGLQPEVSWRGYRVDYIQPRLMDSPNVDISDVLDAIGRCVQAVLYGRTGQEFDPHVTLIPLEGSPWVYNEDSTPFYNARTKKWSKTSRPDWLKTVKVRDPETGIKNLDAVGADFCSIVGTIKETEDKVFSARFPGYDRAMIVTHSLQFGSRAADAKEIAKFINECGGLLFPSLAVGHLPAATFGPVCFVFDPRIVLQSMKPYKPRSGQWPIVTYTTDVWTETMHTFLGDAAVRLFEQLTGNWSISIYGKRHFWTLGPPVEFDHEIAGAKIVSSTSQLRSALVKRAKVWNRFLSPEDVESYSTVLSVERYPYLEAKSNSVLSMDAAVACINPVSARAGVKPFLKAIGFKGAHFELKVPYVVGDLGSLYAWSWSVQDMIAQLPDIQVEVS